MNDQPAQQHAAAISVIGKIRDLRIQFAKIGECQHHPDAKRHLLFGVGRRLLLIERSLVYLINLDLIGRTEHLNLESRNDLDLYLNSFYFHVRALLDNLAWCSAYSLKLFGEISEQVSKDPMKVSLFGDKFIAALEIVAPEVNAVLRSAAEWNEELKKLRDPIAHRIPLYAVPSCLTGEEAKEHERLLTEGMHTIGEQTPETTNPAETRVFLHEGRRDRQGPRAGVCDKHGSARVILPRISWAIWASRGRKPPARLFTATRKLRFTFQLQSGLVGDATGLFPPPSSQPQLHRFILS